MDKKVYYYSDELNDDFAEKSIEPLYIQNVYISLGLLEKRNLKRQRVVDILHIKIILK